jgi:hypothetical protein
MTADLAHRMDRYQTALAAFSAPRLLRGPLRPPLAAAPLEKALTLRELAALARIRKNAAA